MAGPMTSVLAVWTMWWPAGEDINVFVVDTEIYSNTGGQSSKATPLGAVAQFASSGKKSSKKDLGAIFRTYGNVYVAQVAMGADPNQMIRALREAEAHKGPSVIIAYAPCVAHGIRAGMHQVQQEMKRAVDAGYWTLYRYDPNQEKPLTLDSGHPVWTMRNSWAGETQFLPPSGVLPRECGNLVSIREGTGCCPLSAVCRPGGTSGLKSPQIIKTAPVQRTGAVSVGVAQARASNCCRRAWALVVPKMVFRGRR